MPPRRERRTPDPELVAARHKRILGYGLFGLGAFTVVADVFSANYEAPVWVGPVLLALSGTVWAKGASDAVRSLSRRVAPPREDDNG